jgi:hypothetical protein
MNMKRSLLICAAALMMLVNIPQADADQIRLTLDLNNAVGNNSASGGTWQLFARKVETGTAPNGDSGIAGIRALLNNINVGSVTFASGIGAIVPPAGCGPSGTAPCVQTLSNGTVEIVYGQNLGGTVVTNVGIGANANQDRLIASGTWPAGAARPSFGNDGDTPTPFTSEGNFLVPNGAGGWSNSLEVYGADLITSVVTLGDFNGSNTVTAADTAPYRRQLLGTDPYNPAGDFNQSGTVTAADTGSYRAELLETAPPLAAVGAVPEPSTLGLLAFAAMGLITRRRRV